MAALSLLMAACSNDDNEVAKQQAGQPDNKMITITAQLAPKSSNAKTRAVTDDGTNIVVDWAVDEHLAILYEVSSTKYAADARITAVDGSGNATIEFNVEGGTADNTACTIVYPLSAAKDDHSGVKDAVTLLGTQDGTLNANLDVRVGAGTIQTSTPGLDVTTQPAAQFAIFKFTVKNAAGDATIDVKPLIVNIGSEQFTITPASATSTLYAALPAVSGQAVGFVAPGYTFSKPSVTFEAGKYYQSTLKMAAAETINLASLTTAYVAQNGEILTGELDVANYPVKISIAEGAIVTLDGVTINGTNSDSYQWAGITCLDNAIIILKDGTTNTVKGFYEDYLGIHVPSGSTLTIQGTGSLDASSNGAGAGIGGGWSISCGNIVIQGGTITATGDYEGAGIGGGGEEGISCGNIEIQGGTITATGGYEGAGIGGGSKGICGNITINGGTVTATGGYDGAGIGSGYDGSCGDITIESGTVEATGGEDGSGIGCGDYGNCGAITITADVTSLTATKGSGRYASASIGKGEGNSCGTVTVCGTVYWDGSDYQNGGDTYLTTSPFNYPAPPSESFDTNVENQTTYDGTHFTITAGFADSWGIDIGHSRTLTITAKGSETIKKVEFHCTIGSGAVSSTSVTAGTLNWVYDTENGSIDNVNTTTVSMSNSAIDWVQIDQITVYYE